MDLQEVIPDTTVVSAHEYRASENYITLEKLYLLAEKEVWNSSDGSTKQLDIYKNNTSINAQKKYNGGECHWWLRDAYKLGDNMFYGVTTNGDYTYMYSDSVVNLSLDKKPVGISPTFRIG